MAEERRKEGRQKGKMKEIDKQLGRQWSRRRGSEKMKTRLLENNMKMVKLFRRHGSGFQCRNKII